MIPRGEDVEVSPTVKAVGLAVAPNPIDWLPVKSWAASVRAIVALVEGKFESCHPSLKLSAI
jgi:hypothetical protein